MSTWYIWLVAALLAAIAFGFAVRFVRPALQLRDEFQRVTTALEKISATPGERTTLRQRIAEDVMARTSLAGVWAEYAQTLHAQRDTGALRATALAETFFTDQALVDTPLKTEYYKHLPGILTGLGIIGTFTGLIIGLSQFDVSIDPGQAQTQLRNLINAVGHAFVVSAIAITLAMLFTWIEKSLVTACYRLTEHIRQGIDSLFDTGADVEYLERLVAAAESSAQEMIVLKDSLASEIGRALTSGLAQPMTAIASAVDALGARQDDTVTRMISEVVNGFSQRMENLFSGQMQELHTVLAASNQSMREMAGQFTQMAGQLDASGKQAVDAMSARLASAVTHSEERQAAMQQQLAGQADHLRQLIAQSQRESAELLQQLVQQLTQESSAVIASLQAQSKTTLDGQQAQVEHLARTVSTSVGSLTAPIEQLVAASTSTQLKLQETVAALTRSTDDNLRGLNEGAARLGTAAHDFASAGQHVAATMEESSKTADKIRLAANAMQKSAEAAQQMLGDYGTAHDAFARLVDDLRQTIERARREASLSAEISDRLEDAATRLVHAQKQTETYLDGISNVLGHAHQVFAESVERTLREANRQFQGELSQAVGLLSGAVADLGETVETLAEQRRP